MPLTDGLTRSLSAALCTLVLAGAAAAQTTPPQRDAATLAREEAAIAAARIARTCSGAACTFPAAP